MQSGTCCRKSFLCFLSILITLLFSPVAIAKEKPYSPGLPNHIKAPGEKVIIIDPRSHEWGAYNASGELLRGGIATAGSSWCKDIHRGCRTKSGSFRIYSLGSKSCVSRKFPVGRGGAPMPYCMFFNGGQALHGSPRDHVMRANVSHGCVRVHVEDARWIRFNFVEGPNASNGYRGTRVIVRSY